MSEQKASGKRKRVVDQEETKETATPNKAQKLSQGPIAVGKKWFEKDDSSSSEEDFAKEKEKWQQLEHHGVIFYPQYEPHGVPILHKGKELKLTAEQEEVANWWAKCQGQEFSEKPLVLRNFEEAFLEMFDPALCIEKLEDLDFTPLRAYLDRHNEEKKSRSNEEKRREVEERQRKEAKFKYCLFDRELEKLSNCMVEPPGIFRGRGEHPLAGRLKQRIMPEFVVVNTDLKSPIPKCEIPGHSWKEVVSNNAATWLCQYKDERSQKPHQKYVFLAAESRIKGESDKKKYQKARKLKDHIESIRKDYLSKMHSEDLVARQLGVCTYLIDKLALRVGNEKGEEEADTVGCCSLRVEHIQLDPQAPKVTFDFLGKDSMRYFNTVEVEKVVYECLKQFVQAKDPKDDLFDRINPARLNEYLKSHMKHLSAKVFRTYNASITLQKELRGQDHLVSEEAPVEEKKNFYDQCNRQVATLCNHQKAVAKGFDEAMEKIYSKINEKKQKLKDLEKEARSEKGSDRGVALKKRVEKLKAQILADELKARNKEENKSVALGTSKINYMDPRITISWCKRKEMPIEKVFPKTLLSKFAWAMGNEPDWQF